MFNNDYYFIALFRYKPLKPLNQLNETPPIHARNTQRLILMFANSNDQFFLMIGFGLYLKTLSKILIVLLCKKRPILILKGNFLGLCFSVLEF